MDGVGFVWLVLTGLAMSRGEIKIAILMQGSDFINVSIVPSFDVNQFDLGDVFISPCRAGTYNEARDSYCKDCSVCSATQYEREDCIATRNRVCINCTLCTEREQEVCACRQLSPECITGNRICFPLPPTTANITFDLAVSSQLSVLKERFLQEGMRTGFVLFLSEYLGHTSDDITFLYITKLSSRTYTTTFIITNVYSLFTKTRVAQIDQAIVQSGLTNTFGIQSNAFSTVSQQRRRLLNTFLTADNVVGACLTKSLDACGRFFYMTNLDKPCQSDCAALPCPPGYTGFQGICEMCPNATYKPVEGNSSCTPCPLGALSDQGSENASQCWIPTTPPKLVTTSASPTTSSLGVGSSSNVQFPTTAGGAGGSMGGATGTRASGWPSTNLFWTVTSSSFSGVGTSAVYGGLASSTTSSSSSSVSPQVPATTTAASGGGSGGPPSGQWGLGSWINLTVINNYFRQVHSGAERIQYVITINNNGPDNQWAVTMVWALMSVGLMAIAAIGTRLFCLVGIQKNGTYTRIPPVPPSSGKKEIPLPIRLPSPPPPEHEHHHSSDEDDSSVPRKKKDDVFHFQMPKGGFLEQRRLSRSLDDADY